MASLATHRAYLDEAWQAARAAPLSRRKAMLVAALLDAYVDHLFAARAGEDVIAFRAGMARRSPELGRVMALCGQQDGSTLMLDTVAIAVSDYASLGVEDFMVSLYNDHSVQRLRLALPDGQRVDMLALLDATMASLDQD